MISKVKVHYFKQFKDQEFDLSNHIILAGPNNSGKTTLLQAIVVWQLGLKKWLAVRKSATKTKSLNSSQTTLKNLTTAKKRWGVPITRKDFTAIPLRDMKLLWTDCSFSLKKDESEEGKPGKPRIIEITLEGKNYDYSWELTFEFFHQSSEQIYVKPSQKDLDTLLDSIQDFDVIHVPPFSGIGAEETRYDRPFQDLLIGQGKAGDILRNLLLEVYQKDNQEHKWNELCEQIEKLFGYRLRPPEYENKPFILCEYLKGVPEGKGKNGLPQLDIASAGSGFHQVLLLLAFFYARPASVFLLDEPDAHLHVILQKQIYELLHRIAGERSCQLIIATHSEVLIDNTSPDKILSFYDEPHRLVSDVERNQVREALKRITATDILLAKPSTGILYVEGETDFNLLKVWACALNHDLVKWFTKNPFYHINQGRNPGDAKNHFFALRAIQPEIKGFLLLDGDNRDLSEHEVRADGMVVERWKRYEAENYLIHPQALLRYIEQTIPLGLSNADEYLRDQLPPAIFRDPLGMHDYLVRTPASKTLLPELFSIAGIDISKNEYYLIADQMKSDEIAPEVKEKLDAIQKAFGL